ncbi:THO complex subunit 4-like [Aethina tumida]|uniref:THO complex subunit 4-like n=1 Tax=Aethina tumida TaxID=116153 RepID=UPI00096AE81B|nr:THO complex subunit 4-like [Aethina tumida]
MVNKMEMSLDDIIRYSKKPGSGGKYYRSLKPQYARRPGKRDPSFSFPYKSRQGKVTKAPYSNVQNFDKKYQIPGWKTASLNVAPVGGEAKISISNLHHAVSDLDMKELFTEFGDLKSWAVHYDQFGKSLGTAEVIFYNKDEATKAMKHYNGVPLDGRPMKIEMISVDVSKRDGKPKVQENSNSEWRNLPPEPWRGQRRIGGRKRISVEDLDAEMDAYNNLRKSKLT